MSERPALRREPGTQEVLSEHCLKEHYLSLPGPFSSPTDQQLREVGGLDVVIVDHGGDSSHERHPGRHVQVKMAGFSHPEMGARDRQTDRQDVDMLNIPMEQPRPCLGPSTQWGLRDTSTAPPVCWQLCPSHTSSVPVN